MDEPDFRDIFTKPNSRTEKKITMCHLRTAQNQVNLSNDTFCDLFLSLYTAIRPHGQSRQVYIANAGVVAE